MNPLARLSPAVGAAVMALGMLSVSFELDDVTVISRPLLAVAVAGWLVLAAVFGSRLVRDPARWREDSRAAAALTSVAATTVIGVHIALIGTLLPAGALLALATLVWLVLLPIGLGHLPRRTHGTHFLLVVSTQGLATLAAELAVARAQPATAAWLAALAGAWVVLGLALYALVVGRFDPAQLRTGEGDQWVAGGALAISSLAVSELADAIASTGRLTTWVAPVHLAGLALWLVTLAWYVVLIGTELRWPRPHYNLARWSTVFPLGMIAAAAYALAPVDLPWTTAAARVFVWPGLVVCAVVAAGAARRAWRAGPG